MAQAAVWLAQAVDIHVIDMPHDLGPVLHDSEGVALGPFDLHPFIAVGSGGGNVFPLLERGHAPPLEPAVDGLVLPAGHEESKLKILLVGLVGGIVSL